MRIVNFTLRERVLVMIRKMIEKNQRDKRISELEKIIPANIRNKIENSLDSSYAFLMGTIIGGGSAAGAVISLGRAISPENPSSSYVPAIFLGVWFAGLGGIMSWMINNYGRVKNQAHYNPLIQNEIWEWGRRKNYV